MKILFYKYINNYRKVKLKLLPLLNAVRNMITKDKEKADILNAFFTSIFKSQTN